ncbi:MAG TPA: DUF459 domain-containing protein [Pseudolabrys sp.]
MFSNTRLAHWIIGAAILVAADCACVAAIEMALTAPAQAQWRQRSGGFFGNIFGPSRPQYYENEPAVQTDNSRAPSPRKPDPKAEPVTPTSSIVVMGDAMADWLAYGLEDAFSDSPEIAIIRKNKIHSGLLRYEAKSDLDWWHVARDILAQEKPNYVIMMLGVSDRQNISARDVAKEADKKKAQDDQKKDDQKKDEQAKNKAGQAADDKNPPDEGDQPSIIAPEPQQGKNANGTIEFRSDQWADIYSKRIDETIAALKSKGVPVFWVGLPSIKGTKSTADAVYLNDLYRARAERAGAIYIDVWDGFVDEGGKFTTYGPDYEGQNRRLRSGDGVFFTKAGARKLAHYVERELRRVMSNRMPVALPSGPIAPLPSDTKSTVRPVAGPVVPLTVTPANSEELLGGTGSQPAHSDATTARVLVKGEPVPAPPGRADDFAWPVGSDGKNGPPVASAPVAPAGDALARTESPAAAGKPSDEPKRGAAGKTSQATEAKPKLEIKPKQQHDVPRPPQAIRRSGGPFGWLR